MKILITGGAGFIGSHLSEKSLDFKNNVIVIDNLSTGKRDNINHLLNNPMFTFYEDTILNQDLMRDCIEKADQIYHLAAPVGVKWIMDHPVDTILENIRGIDVVCKLANEYKKKVAAGEKSKKVLDDLGLERYCCRAIFLGQEDYIELISKFKKS